MIQGMSIRDLGWNLGDRVRTWNVTGSNEGNGFGTWSAGMNANNGGVGILAVVMSARNSYRFAGPKFNLKGEVSTSATVT